MKLKKEVEARCRISGDSSTVDVEQVKSKMASRVSRYRKVFSGSIYPPSVLVRSILHLNLQICSLKHKHRSQKNRTCRDNTADQTAWWMSWDCEVTVHWRHLRP